MKKILLFTFLLTLGLSSKADVKVDNIPGTLELDSLDYSTQELKAESGAIWIVKAKDEGDGPQIKAGKGVIETKTSAGTVKKIEVTWGKKTNENIVVTASHVPFISSEEPPVELGVIEFSKNETVAFELEGNWEYVSMTSTAEVGKAAKFQSIAVTWEVSGENSIDKVNAQAKDAIIYNLLGQRVYNPGKGLYIINGKKTILR